MARGPLQNAGLITADDRGLTGATLPDRPRAPEAGAIIAGRYRVERELGRGGMGRVFAAYDPKLARRVAIKVLSASSNDDNVLRRFEQEARAAGALNHP